MENKQKHIIQKQIFDLTLRDRRAAFDIQQKVGNICKKQVLPLLDELFSSLVDEHKLVKIDFLEIDLGTLKPNELEQLLPIKILAAVKEKMKQLAEKGHTEFIQESVSKSHFSTWLHYLKTGTIPWNVIELDELKIQKSILDNLATDIAVVNQLTELILQNEMVVERLVKQSDESFLQLLIQASFGKQTIAFANLRQSLQKITLSLPKDILITLFAREDIKARTFFIHYWQVLLKKTFQEKRSLQQAELITHVLRNLSKTKAITPALKTILEAITKQENPIAFLESSFAQIEKQLNVDSSRTSIDIEKKITEESVSKKDSENTIAENLIQTEDESIQESLNEEELSIKKSKEKLKLEEETVETNSSELESIKTTTANSDQLNPTTKTKEEKESEDVKSTDEELTKKAKTNEALDLHLDIDTDQVDEEILVPKTTLAELLQMDTPEGTYYYIDNAGVVLMHPFLQRFFENLALSSKGKFIDITAQEKAVHIIQYLASGKQEQAEYQFVLSKFLCGLPFNFPIDRKIEIEQAAQKEANNLLQAAINHWGALGQVGPDSIREGFLQRPGKLEKRSNGWHLIVEQKTLDILLGKLPWGISMIKLPWMKEMLRVEWN